MHQKVRFIENTLEKGEVSLVLKAGRRGRYQAE